MTDKPKLMGDLEYRLGCGNTCPVCGAYGDIEGGPVDIDGAWAKQECWCGECEAEWVDHYKLQGFSDLKDADGEVIDRGDIPYCITDGVLRRMFDRLNEYYCEDEGVIDMVLKGEDPGDTLAEFIVAEVRDIAMYQPDDTDPNDPNEFVRRYNEVYDTLCRAEDQLNRVVRAMGALAEAATREVGGTADWDIPEPEHGGPPTE